MRVECDKKVQIVTVNLPRVYIDAIQVLTSRGDYPSRSEAIRVALRDFLGDELKMVESLLEIRDAKEKHKKDSRKKTKEKNIDMRSIRMGWK